MPTSYRCNLKWLFILQIQLQWFLKFLFLPYWLSFALGISMFLTPFFAFSPCWLLLVFSLLQEIHTLLISLNFTAIEIKTINSLDSWNGGVLVMVSGLVKTRDFSGRRNFVQSFFLAPQEKGYFVLNDIFQFVDDGRIYQHQAPIPLEGNFDTQSNPSNTLPEPPGNATALLCD